jgi:hypothetical protein
MHDDNDFRQTEIYISEPLVPEPRSMKVELVTEKLERHKVHAYWSNYSRNDPSRR